MIYRDRYGRVIRVQPVLNDNDFWTDTGTGRFINGLITNVNRVQLPTVQTEVSVNPETQLMVKQLQKTLLYTGLAIGGAIILNKIL
jgi:hypothetical protein